MCIHFQVNTPNSSEVAAMLHGLLNHNAKKEIDPTKKSYNFSLRFLSKIYKSGLDIPLLFRLLIRHISLNLH